MTGDDRDSGNGKGAWLCVQVVHLAFPVKWDNKTHLMLKAYKDTVHYLEALIGFLVLRCLFYQTTAFNTAKIPHKLKTWKSDSNILSSVNNCAK